MIKSTSPSADQTRRALVRAALKLFGSKGFDATSTREIAAEAKANIGSIAYHFGGKDGLRTACAEEIVETMNGVAAQVLNASLGDTSILSGHQARRRLETSLETMVAFIVAQPHAGEFIQFILRELAHPSAALDRIYEGVFLPVHRELCRIWEAATGDPAESEQTRLIVFTLIGQVVYFRIGRLAVLRRMGWSEIGAVEAGAIAKVAKDNIAAMISAREGEKS